MYGRRAPRLTTTEVTDFFHVQQRWEQLLEPGAHPPVDLIPILKSVPERWASWKTETRIIRRLQRKLYFGLLERVEERVNKGMFNGCRMETVIENASSYGLDRDAIGYALRHCPVAMFNSPHLQIYGRRYD
jgi:hypothetical protein